MMDRTKPLLCASLLGSVIAVLWPAQSLTAQATVSSRIVH
jgi:hypothetical protein